MAVSEVSQLSLRSPGEVLYSVCVVSVVRVCECVGVVSVVSVGVCVGGECVCVCGW